MSFFYNLNNKLNAIRDLPSTTHGQLNEGVVSELKKSTIASYAKKAAADAVDQTQRADGEHEYGDPRIGQKHDEKAAKRVAGVGKAVDRLAKKEVDEGLGDMARKVGGAVKKVAGKALDTLGHGSDEDLIRGMQKKAGLPQTGKKPMAHPKEGAAPMSAKQKSFAALAEPKDKITFADKIAGAKKEVDEMLGDVAAEAMKQALGGGKQVVASEDDDNNPFTNWKKPRKETPKVGSTERGALHDIEHTATGRKVTRRVDSNTGYSVGSNDDKPADGEKRGRGRPKGAPKAPERVTANATKHKGGRKMTKEGDNESDEIKQAMAMLKKAGYTVEKAAEQVDEKAVSKKQQRFMGMVHATQKGEKAPSKEVAKVAKGMGKKDAEDFAATKHKGLPEKKKPEDKKEKTEETADSKPSKGGVKFGGGIYDSFNRDLENMIKESMARLDESMSINMSMNNDQHGGPSKTLTVTATDDDAMKLSELLKSAGLGGSDDEGYGGGGYKSACGCGQPDCSCGDDELDEVSMNQPDYPTDTETSADPFQYSGGLNKPKSTGQTTTPIIHTNDEERQHSYAEAEEDAIKRMMEMAGIEFTEEMLEEGWKEKLGAAGLAGAMALGSLGAGAAQAAPQQGLGATTTATQQQTQDIWMPAYKRALSLSSATKNPEFKQELDKLSQFYQDQSGRIGVSGKLSKNMEPKAAQDQKQLDLKYKDRLEQLMQRYNANEGAENDEQDALHRMMEMAGIKKKEVDEEKTDEGNKFTSNLAKARAAGKKEADLDGDGDMEKVRESIFDLTNQWRAYKG